MKGKTKKLTIAATPRKSFIPTMDPADTDEVVTNVVKISTVAAEAYRWSPEQVEFLDSIPWLGVSGGVACTQLAEIMAAMQIDPKKTRAVLTAKDVKSFEEVCWSLPQTQQLDLVRQTRSILEQEKPPDKTMDKPCLRKDCKSQRFRCFYGAPSSGDEQIRAWRICSACGTYDDM